MALSHRYQVHNGPGGSGTALSTGVVTKPNLHDLLLMIAWNGTSTTTYSAPTDNGSGTGWQALGSAQGLGGLGIGSFQGFWKVATAADVSSLTNVSCTASTSDQWSVGYDDFTGFLGTPTLDLFQQFSPAGNVSSYNVAPGVAPKANSEIAVSYMNGDGGGFGSTVFTYSPDGGTTVYSSNSLALDLTSANHQQYFLPTTGGSTPQFKANAFNSQHIRVTVASWYDLQAQGNMLAVMGV